MQHIQPNITGIPRLVRQIHDMLAGDLRFPAQHIQPHVLDVAQDRRFAFRIVGKEQVRRIHRAPHQKILSIHLQVKVAALADLRKFIVLVAVLGHDPDAEPDGLPVGNLTVAILLEFEFQIIEVGLAVHEGVYRERISPPRGGESDTKRIVYQAAPGEKVEIKGSEVIKNWVKVGNDTWKVTLPNSFFGSFNPYSDLIHGDWFNPKGRNHHTGAVYLNGDWLAEAAKLDDVMKPMGSNALWFGQVDEKNTTIWAQFKGVEPQSTTRGNQCASDGVLSPEDGH